MIINDDDNHPYNGSGYSKGSGCGLGLGLGRGSSNGCGVAYTRIVEVVDDYSYYIKFRTLDQPSFGYGHGIRTGSCSLKGNGYQED